MKQIPISIILVEPENPDNIGAVARAMKNMGFHDLRLVKPPKGWKAKAKKMAVSAYDLLEEASLWKSLEDAIQDRQFVVGTTRRKGLRRGKFISFDETQKRMCRATSKNAGAFVFGRESKGLDNESVKLCDWVTTIPVSPAYPSINLAQSVMVLCFSIWNAKGQRQHKKEKTELDFLNKAQVQDVLDRFAQALEVLNYGQEGRDIYRRILTTLNGLFKRNGLLHSEAQMFKGFSRRVCENRKKA